IQELRLEGRAERGRKPGAGDSGGTTCCSSGRGIRCRGGGLFGEHCRQFRVWPGRVGHQPTARGDG
ncbi:unnamed protein product, partial [Ectocarpus sp. 12 AP-2014]